MSTGGRAPRPAGVYDYAPKRLREQWNRGAGADAAGSDGANEPEEIADHESDDGHLRHSREQDPEVGRGEAEDKFAGDWQEELAYRAELRERHARAAQFDREYNMKLERLADSLRTLRGEEEPTGPTHAPAREPRATRDETPQDLDRDVYIDGMRLPRFLQPSYVPPRDRGGIAYHLRAILAVGIACAVAAPVAYYFARGNPFAPSREKTAQPALQYTVASTSASLPPLAPAAVHDLQPASAVAPYAPVAAPSPQSQPHEFATPPQRPHRVATTPAPKVEPPAPTPRAVPLTDVVRWPNQAQDRGPAQPPPDPPPSVLALAPTASPSPPQPAPVPASPPMRVPTHDADEIQLLLKQGQDFVTDGDIATARLVLRRAAEAGVAAAALALGRTYDPQVLASMRARGVAPDRAEALRWYEMAQRLGSGEAAQQIEHLKHTE